MKRSLLLAAATLVLFSTAASAFELNCGAPHVALGDEPDNNPVVRVDIKYVPDDHSWRVFHTLRNGLVVSRSEQYAITDASNDRKTQWQGSLNRSRNLYMVGEVRRGGEDGILYLEWLYDRNKNGLLAMHASSRCAMAEPPLPTPTTSAPLPTPSETAALPYSALPPSTTALPPVVTQGASKTAPIARVKDSVPIYPFAGGNAAKIDVLIGGQPLRMLLDTGATTCLITDAIAARLVGDGYAVWQANSRFRMADGTVQNMPMVLIRELRIGSHVVRNVAAGVSSSNAVLLAFPVVNNIAPFTIDTRAGELVFHPAANL
jgi:hypothetical protein